MVSLLEPIIALSADGPDLDPMVHGAKAVGLQRLMRLGLPVPPAVVVPVSSARAIAADRSTGRDELRAAVGALVRPGDRLAVRSGAAVSLPGAFETLLDVAPADVEAATAARAVTYARATLAYVALVDKLQSVLATPLVPAATVINPPAGRTSLFSGDDAGIGRCAAELASFYDSQLRDAEAPQDVLRVMDLDADALDLDAETRSMVFGS